MMKVFKFVPTQLTLFLVVGIVIGNYIEVSPSILVSVVLTLIIFLIATYIYANKVLRRTFAFNILTYTLVVFIGISSITFQQPSNKSNYFGNAVSISLSEFFHTEIQITKVLKPNKYNFRFIGEVKGVNFKETQGELLIYIAKDSSLNKLKVDDCIEVISSIKEIPKPLNPYDFNYKNYLKNEQVLFQTSIKTSDFSIVKNNKKSLIGIAAEFRKSVITSLKENGFRGQELAVINALLLGQRTFISTELMQDYVNAGAIHILAVSGLHVGIILLILQFLFTPLNKIKNGKYFSFGLVLLCLWGYAVLAGLSPSVIRAVTMFTAVVVGMYSNRGSNIYNTLIISMFFLVLIHPFYLFKIGFQLSYLAVFSIVWLQPKFEKLAQPKNFMLKKIWQLFTVSIAAQLGVLPLSLFYFHQFPSLFFISNLVIIPFIGVILALGIVIICLALINTVPPVLVEFYNFIIEKMNAFVSLISSQEQFLFQEISFSLIVMLVVYLAVILFFKWIEKQNALRLSSFLVAIIAIQFVVLYESYDTKNTNELIVFYKSRESIIAEQKGNSFEVYVDTLVDSSLKNSSLINYVMARNIKSVNYNAINKNYFKLLGKELLVIDSLGVYKSKGINPAIVVLRKSPKINLSRMISTVKPSVIIADASNYPSFVELWEQTCLKSKTPFFNVKKNGAVVFN